MNETVLEEALRLKGWIKSPDGSWSAPLKRSEMKSLESAQQSATPKPAKRIRQSRDKLNKLEQEWQNELKRRFSDVLAQSMRFRLGNGIWYKPDFIVNRISNNMLAYEVKGPHAFRGGFENLKVAASQYQWIKWYLVWKENGNWKEQEVLP